MSALRTGRLYPLGNMPGTHFCCRLSQPPGHCAAGRIISKKNSSDTIGNRTRDIPACSAVPQPTAPPRTPLNLICTPIRYIKIDNSSLERAEAFRYLERTLTNQNSIRDEIKGRTKSWNACCHSVQNRLPSSLLYKNIKIWVYRTVILLVVLYGCKTWSLTLKEERRMRVTENSVLRRTFGV